MTVQIFKNIRTNEWFAMRQTAHCGMLKVYQNAQKAKLLAYLEQIGAKIEE